MGERKREVFTQVPLTVPNIPMILAQQRIPEWVAFVCETQSSGGMRCAWGGMEKMAAAVSGGRVLRRRMTWPISKPGSGYNNWSWWLVKPRFCCLNGSIDVTADAPCRSPVRILGGVFLLSTHRNPSTQDPPGLYISQAELVYQLTSPLFTLASKRQSKHLACVGVFFLAFTDHDLREAYVTDFIYKCCKKIGVSDFF